MDTQLELPSPKDDHSTQIVYNQCYRTSVFWTVWYLVSGIVGLATSMYFISFVSVYNTLTMYIYITLVYSIINLSLYVFMHGPVCGFCMESICLGLECGCLTWMFENIIWFPIIGLITTLTYIGYILILIEWFVTLSNNSGVIIYGLVHGGINLIPNIVMLIGVWRSCTVNGKFEKRRLNTRV